MKDSDIFPLLKAGLVLFLPQVLLAALTYFVFLPLTVETSQSSGDNPFLLASILVLAAGLLESAAFLWLGARLVRRLPDYHNIANAVPQPIFLIDGNNRYMHINNEGERALGLNRERDTGTVADSRITAFDSERDKANVNLKGAVEINNRHYQAVASPIPENIHLHGAAHPVRIVFLRDVDNYVRLRSALQEINATMRMLAANTQKFSESSSSFSHGASEQAASLASITSTMSQFSKKIQDNSETAAQSSKLAAQAREAAERSGSEINHALTAMNDVQDAGIRIARIVKLIDDIAFQTNLLALNAAVEAARAGRQGKGFAVVADEVRNLAGRSAKAAKDTAGMVEDVTERIGNATAYISTLEETLKNIVQDAIRMADSAATSSAASAEQAAGILQINHELGQMNNITHATMSSVEHTTGTVAALAQQTASLKAKLELLNKEFSLTGQERVEEEAAPAATINLLDDPLTLDDISSPYFLNDDLPTNLTGQYPPYQNTAAAGNSPENMFWNLKSEIGDIGASHLFSQPLSGAGTAEAAASDLMENRTGDGDRVVKPNQQIVLDDAEFGRY